MFLFVLLYHHYYCTLNYVYLPYLSASFVFYMLRYSVVFGLFSPSETRWTMFTFGCIFSDSNRGEDAKKDAGAMVQIIFGQQHSSIKKTCLI